MAATMSDEVESVDEIRKKLRIFFFISVVDDFN